MLPIQREFKVYRMMEEEWIRRRDSVYAIMILFTFAIAVIAAFFIAPKIDFAAFWESVKEVNGDVFFNIFFDKNAPGAVKLLIAIIDIIWTIVLCGFLWYTLKFLFYDLYLWYISIVLFISKVEIKQGNDFETYYFKCYETSLLFEKLLFQAQRIRNQLTGNKPIDFGRFPDFFDNTTTETLGAVFHDPDLKKKKGRNWLLGEFEIKIYYIKLALKKTKTMLKAKKSMPTTYLEDAKKIGADNFLVRELRLNRQPKKTKYVI